MASGRWYECACDGEWHGPACSCNAGVSCSNQGSCDDSTGQCVCDGHFAGVDCVVCVVLTQTSGSKDRLDVVGGIVESPTGSASLPTSKNKQTAPSAPASSSKGGLDDVVESALKTKSEPAKSASTGVASGIDSQSKSVAPSSSLINDSYISETSKQQKTTLQYSGHDPYQTKSIREFTSPF